MKGYGWTIVMYGVGQPVAYLFAMGVGLATLVDTNSTAAFGGVSYLVFIAPALLISAAVMTAANEFTFPVMDGFKWRRVYYGPHASPLTPEQIAARTDHRRHGAPPAAVRHLLRRGGVVRCVPERLGLGLHPGRHPRRAVLRPAADGLRGLHQGRQRPVRHGDALHRDAAVPVLRHLLPAGHPAACRALDRLDLPDLARHGAGPGAQLRLRGAPAADHRARRVPAGALLLSAGS